MGMRDIPKLQKVFRGKFTKILGKFKNLGNGKTSKGGEKIPFMDLITSYCTSRGRDIEIPFGYLKKLESAQPPCPSQPSWPLPTRPSHSQPSPFTRLEGGEERGGRRGREKKEEGWREKGGGRGGYEESRLRVLVLAFPVFPALQALPAFPALL
jgi:hypothetical protein